MRWMTVIIGLGLAYSPGLAQTSSFWMSDKELIEAFAGKTIAGHYQNGSTFQETYDLNKRLNYIEDQRAHTGKWSVAAGAFCTIYDSKLTGGCFRIHRSSSNCYEFYFHARDEQTAQSLKNPQGNRGASWTARAWNKRSSSTCNEQPSV